MVACLGWGWIWPHLYFFWEEGWGSGGKAELSDALIDQISMLNRNFVWFTCLFFSNFRKISPQFLSIYYVSMGEDGVEDFLLFLIRGGRGVEKA